MPDLKEEKIKTEDSVVRYLESLEDIISFMVKVEEDTDE